MIVNKRELAEIVGKSEEWISQMQRDSSFPVLVKRTGRQGNEYETADVIAWMERRQVSNLVNDGMVDIEEAKRRKIAAEAGLAELELAKEKGEVVLIEEVTKQFGDQLSALRAKLLALPSKTANLVFTAKSLTEAKSILEDAIIEALNEVVGYGQAEPDSGFGSGDSENDPREAEAAAETDG